MGTYSSASERTRYLTLQEIVAEGFGAYSTLRSWIAQDKLPAFKTGKRVKVLREALVDAAPRLSDEQIARLRFAPGGTR
ncbi:helix-turn-helix domain-containing protein [Schaalia sp. ZJ405]|uniref:helix-turn-helix domain-containing protein n=1 Tax=Schaalia sp. ZJ405 TaxID=2709403 RepID=UPI0013EDA339|nr:helix-turn-helix domain-containing protein [Schaalia sp. ZJ405]QPK81272.1 helix-turn-helix domain-containing protein [Schaalia sp. ZJ405]